MAWRCAGHGGAEREARVRATGLRALLSVLDARDDTTATHSEAVAQLAEITARDMGLAAADAVNAADVALVHDIGKVGVPDAILRKRGALTDRDWQVMRLHPEIGERILGSVEALSHLAPAVRAEHERWDGGGYPDGLRGRAIPRASRIVLACDAYQAMVSDRPYRAAMTPDDAVVELHANAGSQFDPEVIAVLVRAIRGDVDGAGPLAREPSR